MAEVEVGGIKFRGGKIFVILTALTTAGGFSVLNFSSLVPLQLFGQVFVVAIVLALVSSLFVLPAMYTPFLKQDAKKYLAENTGIESE